MNRHPTAFVVFACTMFVVLNVVGIFWLRWLKADENNSIQACQARCETSCEEQTWEPSKP